MLYLSRLFYDEDKFADIFNPHLSNKMAIYSYYLKEEREITPISSFQPLMIVKCWEGPNFRNKGSGFCVFETSIFTNKERLMHIFNIKA